MPGKITIRLIEKEHSVTVNTVRRWISGEFRPTEEKQTKISELLQKWVKKLFPVRKRNVSETVNHASIFSLFYLGASI